MKTSVLLALGAPTWNALTTLGNALVLLPAAACMAAMMFAAGRRREALAWSAAILVSTTVTLTLKLLFDDFNVTVFDHTFRARGFPSGHVATATVFWGGLALLVRGRPGMLLALPPVVVATAVLVLHWHHTLDLLAAFSIASAALWVEVLLLRRRGSGSALLERQQAGPA